eukprot:jgi/Orpsp1_1/1181126/evm.model.c7180000075968.1
MFEKFSILQLAYIKLKCFSKKDKKIEMEDFIKIDNIFKNSNSSNMTLFENNKLVIGVYIQIYENTKKNYNKFDVEVEDYYEFKIDEFENFIDDEFNEKEESFEICHHHWSIKLECEDENDFINIYLKNLDIKDENKFICGKFIILFKYYKNPLEYKAFNSSLYCFGKANKNDWDSCYKSNIYKKDFIRQFIKDNKIIIGIYLCIYKTSNELEKYFNNIKSLIKNENSCYEIENENYYEFAVENWDKNNINYNSTYFNIGNYR